MYFADMSPSNDRFSHPTRRRILQTTGGLTALGVLGTDASMPVAADPGSEQWTFETGGTIRSAPTVVDGTAYIGSTDDHLYAVDATTGNEEWAFETPGWKAVKSSPNVVGGTVFVGSDDNNLYAVDASTGEQEWAFETGSAVFSSPTVVDGTVFVGSADDNLYALEAGVEASSEGSRVHLGTLGHHGEWRYADQSIPATEDSESSGLMPGFGVGSGITAIGATGYMLKRRLQPDFE